MGQDNLNMVSNEKLEELIRKKLGIQRSLTFKLPQVQERWSEIDEVAIKENLSTEKIIRRKINAAIVIFGINKTTGNQYRTTFDGHPVYEGLMQIQDSLLGLRGDDAHQVPKPTEKKPAVSGADLTLGEAIRKYLSDYFLSRTQMTVQTTSIDRFVRIVSSIIASAIKTRETTRPDYSKMLMDFCSITEQLFPGASEDVYCDFVDNLIRLAKSVINDPMVNA